MFKYLCLALTFASVVFFGDVSQAQRPTAPQLFSEKAIVYFRVNDVRELKEKMSQSATGRLYNDRDVKPFFNTFYASIAELAQGMQQEIGISLDELLSIPNGELAIAVMPTPQGRPNICFMIEAGEEMPAVEILLGRFEKRLIERESLPGKATKQVGRIEISSMINPSEGQGFGYFIDSGVLVGTLGPEYIETLAQIWQQSGVDHVPLAENRDFTSILTRCVGTEGERPQISFYANPIGIARESMRNSPSALVTLAAIKTLGLDGVKGVGGSAILGTNDFDSVVHAHILLDNARQGVLRVLKPKSGSTEPEPWVDEDVVSYSTINWDLQASLRAVREMVETFAGEEAFDDFLVKTSRALGFDFQKDFWDLLDDRITIMGKILPSKKINSQSNLLALHVKEKDKERFSSVVLPRLFERASKSNSRWREMTKEGVRIYYLDLQDNNPSIRPPQPAFAMLDSCMLVSDSPATIEMAIQTYQGGGNLLADAIEFKLIREKIKAQLNGQEYSIMSYQRPDEQLRLFYDLAADSDNVGRLEEAAANNPLLMALVKALRNNKLPPFETIAKYMVPTGAFIIEEENGLHYTAFSLKRE